MNGSKGSSSCLGQLFASILVPLSLILLVGAGVLCAARGSGDGRDCVLSSSFPPEVMRWCELITLEARQNDLPPDLLAALIWHESGGQPHISSHSGAVGLMQIMPRDGLAAQFICPKGPCFADRPPATDLLDPAYNVRYGAGLLAALVVEQGGDLRAALRLYGPMDVGYRYADTILAVYNQYGNP